MSRLLYRLLFGEDDPVKSGRAKAQGGIDEFQYNIVVIGDRGVGKATFVNAIRG